MSKIQHSFGKRIRLFDKTPENIVCPHFWELVWARGCPYSCAYCYLQGTYRIQGKQPYFYPLSETEHSLDLFFARMEEPQLLNSGELADSLMAPVKIIPIIQRFLRQDKHKLLLLTKTDEVKYLLGYQDVAIYSVSLNADSVARRWEKGAPPVQDRIDAAKKCADAGYQVRVRIDPMAPVPNWLVCYQNLVDTIFENFRPERITLGSLRGLQSTINNAKEKSWVQYVTEPSGWGLKIPFQQRQLMYKRVIDYLWHKYNYQNVALCKETTEMWRALGLDPGEPPEWKSCHCNCVL